MYILYLSRWVGLLRRLTLETSLQEVGHGLLKLVRTSVYILYLSRWVGLLRSLTCETSFKNLDLFY